MTIRDLRVVEFLQEFKIARTSVLSSLFFGGNKRVAQRRLKAIVDEKAINRVFEGEYVYYSKLPKQYSHSLALTDYIAYLAKEYSIDLASARAEYKCGDARADALLTISGKPCFVEVQLTDAADIAKYLALKTSRAWENSFKSFPAIRVLGRTPSNRYGLDVYVDNPKNVYSFNIR